MDSASSSSLQADRSASIVALRAIIASLDWSARAIERQTGLTNAQLFLLRALDNAQPLSVNELAERARIGQNTVSTVVTRLVAAGLVRKARSPVDGRSVALSLTAKARRLIAHAPLPPTATLLNAVDLLAPDDVRALAHGLAAVSRIMGLDGHAAPMLFERFTI